MYNLIQIHEREHFGNDWGFYVDIEASTSSNKVNFDFSKKNYNKNKFDKIHEDLEYYKEPKKMEELLKKKSSSLLFNISSLALITAAISYCFSY
jgi:hypothetical protein